MEESEEEERVQEMLGDFWKCVVKEATKEMKRDEGSDENECD